MTELLADGGAVGIQVSLDAADQGLRVIARLEKLTREQRETLCQEMVELLAAHGFPATEISLNGETLLGRPGQKEPR